MPQRVVSGDTRQLRFSFRSDEDFGPSPIARLRIRFASQEIRTVDGSFVGDAYQIDLTHTETLNWTAGTAVYHLTIAAADNSAVVTVDNDIFIVDDPTNTSLSPDELALQALLDIRQFRLENHQTTIYYTIGDRQVSLMPLPQLNQEIERLREIVSRERNRGRFARIRL